MKRFLRLILLLVLTLSMIWIIVIPAMADPAEIDVKPTSKGNVSEIGNIVFNVKNKGSLITDIKIKVEGENTADITPFKRNEIAVLGPDSPLIGYALPSNSKSFFSCSPTKTDKTVLEAGGKADYFYTISVPAEVEQKGYPLKYVLSYKTKEGVEEIKTDKFYIEIKSPNPMVKGLRWLLDMLAKINNNYGLAVILFAIFIKILLWPLNTITMKSQAQMQQLQPKISEINTLYKTDPQRKNEEIMRLYKEEKINPASSCLYLLPQLVVLWLLYSALQNYTPLFQQSFLWLPSLGSPDPLFIFPALAGVSTFFQSLSSGQANDPQTKTFTYIMPLFFFYIMMNFPAALSLFWTVFGLVSWAQQHMYMRNHPKPVTSAVEVKPRSNEKVGKK